MNRLLINSTPSDQSALHKLVVQVAVTGSFLAVAILGTFALATGNRQMLIDTWAPALAALIFTAQLVFKRPNAVVAMAAGIGVVVLTFPMVGKSETILAAALAVVAMSTVASLFVRSHTATFLVVGSLSIVLVPIWWTGSVSDGIGAGVVMLFSFLIGSSAFMLIRRQAAEIDQRFRRLFERAPVALIEQDWSEALTIIHELGPETPDGLRATLEAHPEIMDSIIGAVEVTRCNDLASQLMVDSHPLLSGSPRQRNLPDADRRTWLNRIIDVWSGEAPDSFDCHIPATDDEAEKWFEINTIRVGARKSPNVILAVSDVTESRRKSADLADLVREKDAFVATVSHELRTPLTAVVGLANEVLQAEDLSAADERELLEMVVNQANEISYLVEDLLVGARTHIGTITVTSEEVDLGDQVEAVLSAIPCEITTRPTDERVWALADSVRVRQIIRNLAINADRYGGNRRRLVVHNTKNGAILEMRDDGPPLNDDDRIRIFEPYTRAHDRPGVTMSVGLGLAVSRQLAKLMNGDLEYDHDGLESIFRLSLPSAFPVSGASDSFVPDEIALQPH